MRRQRAAAPDSDLAHRDRWEHAAIAALLALYALTPLHPVYLAGVAAVAALVAWEHTLVRPDDLSQVMRAFNLNGWVSLGYFVVTATRLPGWWRRGRIPASGDFLQRMTSTVAAPPGAPEKAAVRSMFEWIAPRYDLLNRLLSAGSDVRWRRTAVDFLELNAPLRVLDLCTGTADLLVEAVSRDPRNSGLGVDFAQGMLTRGARKLERRGLAARARLAGGDGERLPVRSASFDAALVGFGRHVEQLPGHAVGPGITRVRGTLFHC